MSPKEISKAFEYQTIMNKKFGWRACTMTERLRNMGNKEMDVPGVYKMLNIKATKKGITFFLWFADDEIIEVMVNEYACDAYDISDMWRDIIWK